MKVVVWNEYIHEKCEDAVKKVYPEGIHGQLKRVLEQEGVEVTTATLDDPECGLSEEVLKQTDVLLWWGHVGHKHVPDEIVDRVQRAVLGGMGLIVLHSGHNSKIFHRLMGTSCSLKWREGARERVWTIQPNHPIAEGVDETFVLSDEEMYGERFDVPSPDEVVFLGWFQSGEVFRSGCTWTRGHGRIFYFQPGHECYPTYYDENVKRILRNAVKWACPIRKGLSIECQQFMPLEE